MPDMEEFLSKSVRIAIVRREEREKESNWYSLLNIFMSVFIGNFKKFAFYSTTTTSTTA